GFLEHVPEGPALLAHLAEDEVAGAVDDAGQPVDAVGRQTFADRLDDRDAAGNRRFEGDDHALLAGTGEDLVAMHGDQRLVGGNHVLAVVDGLEYQFLGQGVAADQLDDDVDLGVIDQFEDIAGHGNAGGVVLRLGRTNGNLGNLDAATGAPSNLLGIAFEYIQSTATDGAQTTDAHFDRLHTQFPISTARNGRSMPRPQIKSRTLRSGCLLVNPPSVVRLQRNLGQLRRWLVTRNHLAVGQNDGRRAVNPDHLTKLVLLGHRIVTGC